MWPGRVATFGRSMASSVCIGFSRCLWRRLEVRVGGEMYLNTLLDRLVTTPGLD